MRSNRGPNLAAEEPARFLQRDVSGQRLLPSCSVVRRAPWERLIGQLHDMQDAGQDGPIWVSLCQDVTVQSQIGSGFLRELKGSEPPRVRHSMGDPKEKPRHTLGSFASAVSYLAGQWGSAHGWCS